MTSKTVPPSYINAFRKILALQRRVYLEHDMLHLASHCHIHKYHLHMCPVHYSLLDNTLSGRLEMRQTG